MKHLFFILFSIVSVSFFAQTTKEPITVFIDCNECYSLKKTIEQELKNVNFVRDQKDSDVHVFFTTAWNASNGKSYEIEFIGQNDYTNIQDKLFFNTNANMTELEVSDKVLKYLHIGLMRFWVENGLAEELSITIKTNKETSETESIDPWNKWSFRVGINGWFNGQEFSKFSNVNLNVSGEQITEKNKFNFRMGISQNKSIFIYGDEKIISDKKSKYFSVSDVLSINEHWSSGLFLRMGNSVYSNYKLYAKLQPGVEYNLFPYSESSKKQLIVRYKVGTRYNNYYETTIFNKEEELLWTQSATVGTTLRKKWGSVTAEFEYENYLHDMTLDEFNFYINSSIRVFKGFSLRLNGSYGITHNQINIPASGATYEEMLLQQRQIRSGYNYYASVGVNYNFGSIFNTVVNTRFD